MMVSETNKIEDLIEFYNQWPDLRAQVKTLLNEGSLQSDQRKIITSMIHVVDCVGPADLSCENK